MVFVSKFDTDTEKIMSLTIVCIYVAQVRNVSQPNPTIKELMMADHSAIDTDDQSQGRTKKKVAAPAGDINTTNPAMSQTPQYTVPTMGDILSKFTSTGSLSQEGYAYIDSITEGLARKDASSYIKQMIITNEFTACAYSYRGARAAIAIVFSESFAAGQSPVSVFTKTGYKQSIVNALSRNHLMCKDILMITPDDYRLAGVMANHVSRYLTAYSSDEMLDKFTLQSFITNDNSGVMPAYDVEVNTATGRDIINSFNPHASAPRTDLNLVFKMIPKHSNRSDNDAIPIVAVGGYVKFVDTSNQFYMGNDQRKLRPLVVITSVVSQIMHPGMVALGTALAARHWILSAGPNGNPGWVHPFSKFSPNEPNIGNLAVDEDGKPVFLDSMQKLTQFIQTMLLEPVLCIDIPEGRARMPEIDKLISAKSSVDLYNNMCSFFNLNAPPITGKLILDIYKEIIGVTGDNLDSRYIDYLTMVSRTSDVNRFQDWLFIPSDENVRGEAIGEVTEYKPLYRNNTIVLEAAAILQLHAQLQYLSIKMGNFGNNNMASGLQNISGFNINNIPNGMPHPYVSGSEYVPY